MIHTTFLSHGPRTTREPIRRPRTPAQSATCSSRGSPGMILLALAVPFRRHLLRHDHQVGHRSIGRLPESGETRRMAVMARRPGDWTPTWETWRQARRRRQMPRDPRCGVRWHEAAWPSLPGMGGRAHPEAGTANPGFAPNEACGVYSSYRHRCARHGIRVRDLFSGAGHIV